VTIPNPWLPIDCAARSGAFVAVLTKGRSAAHVYELRYDPKAVRMAPNLCWVARDGIVYSSEVVLAYLPIPPLDRLQEDRR
jgi:hypothetical protein